MYVCPSNSINSLTDEKSFIDVLGLFTFMIILAITIINKIRIIVKIIKTFFFFQLFIPYILFRFFGLTYKPFCLEVLDL